MVEINSSFIKDDEELDFKTTNSVYSSIKPASSGLKFNLINEPTLDIPIPDFGFPGSTGNDYSLNTIVRKPEDQNFGYDKLLINNGKALISIGCIVMVLDPLIPAIYFYFYSIFPAGVFMFVSGVCSIISTKHNRVSLLIVSLTFNILAIFLVFVGYSLGVFVATKAFANNFDYYYIYSKLTCRFKILCYPNIEFYNEGIKGLSIFNAVSGSILLVWLIWDSSVKCVELSHWKTKAKI